MIRSDETRKQLGGVSALTRLGPAGYTADVTRRVYQRDVSACGYGPNQDSVIVDAVFARAADRDAIEEVAAAARLPFVGLWLDAPSRYSSNAHNVVARTRRTPIPRSCARSSHRVPARFAGPRPASSNDRRRVHRRVLRVEG